jgi:HSP20 family molecular chaperone IbpA
MTRRRGPQSMLLIGGYGMSDFDFSPLFRSTIGFDRLMRLADAATRAETGGYPPYNI